MTEIVIRNLWKEYPSQIVLERLNFTVFDRAFCALVGPSGCGKTTFLRMLLSMEKPTRGEILIDGKPIAPEPNRDRGIVFQRYSVFPNLTVLGNAMLGAEISAAPIAGRLFGARRRAARDTAVAMLDKVGLGHALERFPSMLSGGMQQRLAIAQALLCRPKVLLLDEPFGALDAETKVQIHALMLDLWREQKMTIFMVTHDLLEAFNLATRVLAFDKVRRDPQAPEAYGATLQDDVDLVGKDVQQKQKLLQLLRNRHVVTSGGDPLHLIEEDRISENRSLSASEEAQIRYSVAKQAHINNLPREALEAASNPPRKREKVMPAKRFHLGWFTNFTTDEWNGPFSNGGMPWDGSFHVDMAKMLERACFDYIMLEDKLAVSETYGGTSEAYLKNALGFAPKQDPVPLATLIAGATEHLGVVATMSTLGYPPFLLARLCSTVDSIAGGRFGWNIVTSAENAAAQNFGLDELPPRELRYEMAHEYMELCYQLWNSWTPGAIVRDRATGTYADYTKVNAINFAGKYFKCRGPLNTVRSPQGVPALVQAGGSPRGRDFAAKHADSIIAIGEGIEGMREYRYDIRGRARAHGRNPDDIKVLFLVAPVLGETEGEAWEKYRRMSSDPQFLEQCLVLISAITDIDFKKYDLDKPLPEKLHTNGEQGSLDMFQQWGSNKSLRDLVVEASGGIVASVELVGTPEQVAEKMGQTMEAVGGDGFLITTPVQSTNRRTVIEVCEGLVPALQRRGLVRTEYTGKTLKENLRAF